MASDVTMPRLSDSMEEGTVLKWLVEEGGEVKRGAPLVEIETDKANMTYEADQDGALKIVAQEGDTLAVGETIAQIGGGSDGAAATQEEPKAEAEEGGEDEPGEAETQTATAEREEGGGNGRPTETPQEAPARTPEPSEGGNGGRTKASPVARRMARELGLELAQLQGTGPGGRIVKADVEAAAKGDGAKAAAPAEAEPAAPEAEPEEERKAPPAVVSGEAQTGKGETTTQDLTRLQQTVARRMAESKATAPDFVLTVEVDMEEAVARRKQLKAAAGDQPAPSFNDFVIKASALALRDFPRANGAYRDGKFELYGRVNVGVAVAGQDALVVPTVFDADTKSLGHIARESRAVAERVRAGAITPPELSSGTFTVSNLGMYGIKRFVAVINPPQAAILAVGALEPRPVVRDRKVEVRSMMELTLSCDHRILYGADAAEFLAKIREYLENPLRLAL